MTTKRSKVQSRAALREGVVAGTAIALAGTVIALASLVGCSSGTADDPHASTPRNVTLSRTQQQSIRVITVEPAQYRTGFTTTGVVDFDHDRATAVLAPFSGPVTRVLVTLGQHVARGQAMARVASPDFTTAVGAYRKALITASAADAVAANDRALYAAQAISQRENADAQAAAVGADADRTAALQALVALHMDPKTIADIRAGKPLTFGEAVIRAPIAGTVVEKSIAAGQSLSAGSTPCFTIADTSSMWVMAHVFAEDVARVRVGDPATVDPGDGVRPLTGTITNIGPVVDTDTRAVAARVSLDDPGGALKKQMYVQVHVESREEQSGLLVPVSAVLRDGENLPFVYVVEADGSYARRPVTLGSRVADRFVIREGLHAGDRVVAEGGIFLHFIETQ